MLFFARIGLVALTFLLSVAVTGQVQVRPIPNASIPKTIRYQSKPVQVLRFTDKTGNYIALTTHSGEQVQKGDGNSREAHLYAYVYGLKASAPVQLWQMHDRVTDCPLDIKADFVPGSFAITDLDKNGIAEVWVAYRLSCRGDISPSDLKIIMHEGIKKYAKRGVGKLSVGGKTQHDGGVITSDDFGKSKAVFKQYAGRLWEKYLMETI